jgi:hypothetical protein
MMTINDDKQSSAKDNEPKNAMENPFDFVFKVIFPENHDNLNPTLFPEFHKYGKQGVDINVELFRNEHPLLKKNVAKWDFCCRYKAKPGAILPSDYDPSADYLQLIEYENERRAENLVKHMYYIVALLEEYYKYLNKNFFLDFSIIYGPIIHRNDKIQTNFGSFSFNTTQFILSETDEDELISRLQDKIANGLKATYLERLQLVHLPTISSDLYKTLIKADEVISDPVLTDSKFVKDASIIFFNLFHDKLSSEQWQSFIGETKMGNLVAMIEEREEWTREDKLELKADIAKRLLKDKVSRKNILNYLQVTEEWLRELEKRLQNN